MKIACGFSQNTGHVETEGVLGPSNLPFLTQGKFLATELLAQDFWPVIK
jgi:hypothetical protein